MSGKKCHWRGRGAPTSKGKSFFHCFGLAALLLLFSCFFWVVKILSCYIHSFAFTMNFYSVFPVINVTWIKTVGSLHKRICGQLVLLWPTSWPAFGFPPCLMRTIHYSLYIHSPFVQCALQVPVQWPCLILVPPYQLASRPTDPPLQYPPWPS